MVGWIGLGIGGLFHLNDSMIPWFAKGTSAAASFLFPRQCELGLVIPWEIIQKLVFYTAYTLLISRFT